MMPRNSIKSKLRDYEDAFDAKEGEINRLLARVEKLESDNRTSLEIIRRVSVREAKLLAACKMADESFTSRGVQVDWLRSVIAEVEMMAK